MNIIQKIKSCIFKKETKKRKPINENPEYMFDLIEQGLKNGWYKEVTKIEPIKKDIEFLKKYGDNKVIKNYILRLEERIEEIKIGN